MGPNHVCQVRQGMLVALRHHDIHRRKEGRAACVTSGLATSSLICFGRLVLDFVFLLGGLATLATPALGLDFLFLLGAWWDTASTVFQKRRIEVVHRLGA